MQASPVVDTRPAMSAVAAQAVTSGRGGRCSIMRGVVPQDLNLDAASWTEAVVVGSAATADRAWGY